MLPFYQGFLTQLLNLQIGRHTLTTILIMMITTMILMITILMGVVRIPTATTIRHHDLRMNQDLHIPLDLPTTLLPPSILLIIHLPTPMILIHLLTGIQGNHVIYYSLTQNLEDIKRIHKMSSWQCFIYFYYYTYL